MKSFLLAALAALLPAFSLTAQAPAIANGWPTFGRVLDNAGKNEGVRYALATSDGNYLLVGITVQGTASNVWAVKLNSVGAQIAQVMYPLSPVTMPQSVTAVELPDGYAIVASQTNGGDSKNWRFMVAKTNLAMIDGTSQVSKGSGSSCIAQTTGSAMLLMGSPVASSTNRAAQAEVLDITDLTTAGAIQLDGFFGGGPAVWGEGLHLILPTPDGGFYLLGEDTRYEGGTFEVGCNGQSSDLWVCKMDANLAPVWSRTYGGTTADFFLDAALRDNGNLVVLGRTTCGTLSSGPRNVGAGTWLLEISPQGEALNAVSLNAFQSANGSVSGMSLLKDCPDGLLLSGSRGVNTPLFGTVGYLAKVRIGVVNNVGNSVIATFAAGSGTWKREFAPGTTTQRHFIPEDIQQLTNGQILAWGTSSTSSTFSGNFWSVLLNADGTNSCAGNPTVGAVTVNCGDNKANETTAALSTSNAQYGNYLGIPNLPATAYAGPEKVYKIILSERTNLRVTLDIVTANIGLDLFLFGSSPLTGCIGASTENNKTGVVTKKEILEKMLEPGTYFVVVDGRLATDKGVFNIKFECGACESCNCTETAADLPTAKKRLSENFDQYNIGLLDPQNTRWSTEGSAADSIPRVAQLATETKTMRVLGSRMPTTYDLSTLPDGRYRLSWRMFVANGKNAAYDLFGQNNPVEPGFVRVNFNPDGTGNFNPGNESYQFLYKKGGWNQVVHLLDLGQDSIEFWVNGNFVARRHIYYNNGQDNDPPNDFPEETLLPRIRFTSDANSDYRVDDLCLWETTGCTPPPPPVPNTCLTVPSDRIFTSLAAAQCDLYTPQETQPCQTVCELNGTVFHRDPDFTGIVGPAAPPSLALVSDCVQQQSGWDEAPRYADLVTFYNESSKRIGINFNYEGGSSLGDARAFVFQCLCDEGLDGALSIDGNTVTANDCEQICLGEVNEDYDGNSPRPRGYYYILILSPGQNPYSLDIIPEGPCGANITPLVCGTPAGGSLAGEDNTFPTSFPAAYQNYSGNRSYTGRDKIYSFTLQRPQHIDLSLSANRAMGFFLYTDQCGTNPILYRETPILGGTAQLDSFFLPAATYFLSVDEVVNNTVARYSLLLSNCSDSDVSKFLPQFSAPPGASCPTAPTAPHAVALGANVFAPALANPQPGQPAINLNDLVQFKYKDLNGQERTSAHQFWNGVTLNFALAADAPGGPKCGYATGDPLQIAIQHYYNGASWYADYEISPASGTATYQAGGSTSVVALKEIKKPSFFKVNPLFLNPSHKGEDYRVRGRSSDFAWEVTEHEAYDWIKVPAPTGEPNTEDDKKIEFEPNTGPSPREAKLIFRSTSTNPDYKNFVDTVRIVQRGTNCPIPPAATIVTPAAVCAGQIVTLSASHSPANPYYEYQWSNGKTGKTITEIAPDLIASAATATYAYTLTVFDRACNLTGQPQTVTVTVKQSDWKLLTTPAQTLTAAEKSGSSIARFGDWAAVGSPDWNAGASVTKAGRVLLYKRTSLNPEVWTKQNQELKAPTPTANDFFGYALSMHGDHLIVGAPAATNTINGATAINNKPGAAYIFRKNADDTWSQVGAKMSQSTTFDNFGAAVALHGDYAFVGADAAIANTGRAYIYHRNEGSMNNWGYTNHTLLGSINGTNINKFGCSLMADGDFVAVGAKNPTGTGAAFVFQHKFNTDNLSDLHNWEGISALQVPVGEDLAETGDQFGHAIALRGNYLLVGAPFHDDDNTSTASNRGAAWLYERDLTLTTGWKKVRKLVASGVTRLNDDFFGSSLALGDGYAAVGAPFESNSDAGAAYLFHKEKKDGSPVRPWASVRRITTPNPPANNNFNFGTALSIGAQSLIVGAPGFDVGNTFNLGQTYFFKPVCFGQSPTDERDSPAPTTANEGQSDLSTGIALQCRPIPFGDELTIEVSTDVPAQARIEIRDVLDRVVGTVHEGRIEGKQTFTWNAPQMPPGVYYIRVKTERGQVVQPVVHLR